MIVKRRDFVPLLGAAIASVPASFVYAAADPWPADRLMEAATLVGMLRDRQRLAVIFVGFPVLYRQKHIPHAPMAGPASKPEGLELLKGAVEKLPKDTLIVLYCGCCPMAECPNIRPAYQVLTKRGYTNVSVLNLPKNFHSDWEGKGYPVELGSGAA